VSRVYFTDRDLGKRFPEILTTAGLTLACLFELIHPLLEPVLRRDDVFEELPLIDDDLRKVTELHEP